MVTPERRTRSDLVVAVSIAVLVAAVAAAIWWTSDARVTRSRPAPAPAQPPAAAKTIPLTLRPLWTAASAQTPVPVVVAGVVVTGDGRTVTGRDPATGAEIWTFARDRELCGVSWIYHLAVAVYPDGRGCGQVSTIDGSTGRRGPTRSGFADKHIELSSNGDTVLAAGLTRLDLWRSDMVRVIGFGEVDARVKPKQVGIGEGCRQISAASSSDAVSVLQACADSPDIRLTLLRPADQDDEPEQRDVTVAGVGAEGGARVVAVSGTSTAVYLPAPHPRVAIYDDTGAELSSTPLPGSPTPAAARADSVTTAGGLITWWTGSALMVFDANKLAYRYTIPGDGPAALLGPAAMMANRLLVPVTDGIGVYEPSAGTPERVIPVTRPAGTVGPIVPNIAGATVLEQRDTTLVALG